jgi:hypothetical protein
VDSKRMRLPSGDHRGWRSALVEVVSRRGGVLPSVAASHKFVVVLLAARSTVPT